MRLVLDFLFVYKFLWDYGYLYHYEFYSIHNIVQVKYFMSMHMYIDLMSEMALLTCSFMGVKTGVGVLTSPE